MAITTKKQLAEQVMRIVQGGHIKPDNPMDIRELMLHVDQIRDEIVLEMVKVNGGLYVDPAFVSYYEDTAVLYDAAKNLRYITLPANPISLPRNMGVYSISPMQNIEDQFIPMPPSGSWLYRDTMALDASGITKYFMVGNKIFFRNIDSVITLVLVGLVASSKDILESARFPLTPEAERILIQKLLQLFGIQQQAPHDETENGQKNG